MPMKAPFDSGRLMGAARSTEAGAEPVSYTHLAEAHFPVWQLRQQYDNNCPTRQRSNLSIR